jgi:hypothetical protein
MSWELHLSGAILGVALAIVYRRWDITPIKRYAWEDDDSIPDWFPQHETPPEESFRDVSSAEIFPPELPASKDASDKPPG